jgi:hypothetical protein
MHSGTSVDLLVLHRRLWVMKILLRLLRRGLRGDDGRALALQQRIRGVGAVVLRTGGI